MGAYGYSQHTGMVWMYVGVTGRRKGSRCKDLFLGFMSFSFSYLICNQPSAKTMPILHLQPYQYIGQSVKKLSSYHQKIQRYCWVLHLSTQPTHETHETHARFITHSTHITHIGADMLRLYTHETVGCTYIMHELHIHTHIICKLHKTLDTLVTVLGSCMN